MGKNGQQRGRIGGFVGKDGKEVPAETTVGVVVDSVEKSNQLNPDGSPRTYVTIRVPLGPAERAWENPIHVDARYGGRRQVLIRQIKRGCESRPDHRPHRRALDELLHLIEEALDKPASE